MMFNTFFKKTIEFAASDTLYNDCWLNKMPSGYVQPSEENYQWLWKYVGNQNYYKALTVEEHQLLKQQVKKIACKVPMINEYGKNISIYHRLYLAFLMAKPLLYLKYFSLDIISSVVIYPNYKLRKKNEEAGLVFSKGRNNMFMYTQKYQFITSLLLEDFSNHRFIQNFDNKVAVIKELKSCKTEIDYLNESIYKNESTEIILKKAVHLKEKMVSLFENIVKDKTNELSSSIKQDLTTIFNQIKELLQLFIDNIETLNEENSVSIHLSWSHVFLLERVAHKDIVIHEMAHAIDFYNGGMNGVPINTRKFKEVWENAFTTEKKKFTESKSFLDPYGFENKKEFLAVCSEAFFNTPDLLKENIPDIYNSLKIVYGYQPTENDPISEFALAKKMLFSKLRASKLA